MLILTRKTDERICIGNDIEISILEVKGNTVRVGVQAPRDVAVHREEIYIRIARDQEQDNPTQR